MNDYIKNDVIPKVPPLPPQLVQLIEKAREATIATKRKELDELLKMTPMEFTYDYSVEVLGDVAEEICGARVCTITGNGSEYCWKVTYQGINGNWTERNYDIESIYEAFDPDRKKDKERLGEEP